MKDILDGKSLDDAMERLSIKIEINKDDEEVEQEEDDNTRD